jgi:GTPase SAR1 family protein
LFSGNSVGDEFKTNNNELWDKAGQDNFLNLVPMHFRDVNAVIIVFSVDDEKSFSELAEWYKLIDNSIVASITTFLGGNKIDNITKKVVNLNEAKELS